MPEPLLTGPDPDVPLTGVVDPEPEPEPELALGLAPVPLAVAIPEALDPLPEAVGSLPETLVPGTTTSAVEEPLAADDATVVAVDEATVVTLDDDSEGVDALQDRSYNGGPVNVEPTIPKLGLGVAGDASCRVNLYEVGQ